MTEPLRSPNPRKAGPTKYGRFTAVEITCVVISLMLTGALFGMALSAATRSDQPIPTRTATAPVKLPNDSPLKVNPDQTKANQDGCLDVKASVNDVTKIMGDLRTVKLRIADAAPRIADERDMIVSHASYMSGKPQAAAKQLSVDLNIYLRLFDTGAPSASFQKFDDAWHRDQTTLVTICQEIRG